MPQPSAAASDPFARFEDAEVIFVCQDGLSAASARVRCYGFARALNARGVRAEVLSFVDHLGAADASGPSSGVPDDEKLRLNLRACEALRRNPRALLYLQKTGYHVVAVALAAGINGNPVVLDYDDYDLDCQPYRRLEPWIPSLAPDALLGVAAGRARAFVASSRRVFDILRPMNPNAHLIHTVADAALFNPDSRDAPRRRFGDRVNVLWCGDVWGDIPMKDILFAAEAFAVMPRRVRAKARFHVIGFGRAWETLKARARERHPDLPELVFHERVPPAEFGAVLAEMDIGVLPYSRNDFNIGKSPTKMFEYLVAKVAVCATPVGEVTHCLEDGRSALLADGLEGFSAALARLIDDGALRARVAEEAYRIGMARYTLQGIGDRLEGIVRAAMEPAGVRARAVGGPSVEEHMARALGRARPIAPREVVLARRDLAALAAAPDPEAADPRRWTAPLLALLDWPGLAGEGVGREQADRLKQAGQRLRNAARLKPHIRRPPAERPPGPPALCKLAAAEDWEDEGWYAWACRFKTNIATFSLNEVDDVADRDRLVAEDRLNHVYNFFKRSRGLWERVQHLFVLDRLGALDGAARILVVAAEVDGFYLFLTGHAAHVDVLDVGPRAGEHAERVAAGEADVWLTRPRPFHRDRITVHHGAPPADSGPWDAAVVLNGALETTDAGRLLARIDAALKPGGVVSLAAEVRLDLPADDPGAATARETGWRPAGPFDGSINDATLDRLATVGAAGMDNPHFVVRDGDALRMAGVWAFAKKTRGL